MSEGVGYGSLCITVYIVDNSWLLSIWAPRIAADIGQCVIKQTVVVFLVFETYPNTE